MLSPSTSRKLKHADLTGRVLKKERKYEKYFSQVPRDAEEPIQNT